MIDRRTLVANARMLLESLGTRSIPRRQVRSLGVAEQQMVEIAKALSIRARILIMDEPTSALTASEIDQLFAAIRRFTADGVSVIYISHRLEELARVGHRATVLRDGRYIGTRPLPSPIPELVRMMANRDVSEHYPPPTRRRGAGDPARRGSGARHPAPRRQLHASPGRSARRGRPAGCGPHGARARHRRRGSRPTPAGLPSTARPFACATPATRSARASAWCPRIGSSRGSCCRRASRRISRCRSFARLGRAGRRQSRAGAARSPRRWTVELRIRTPGIDTRVLTLSGGNQQKVVLGKWLASARTS